MSMIILGACLLVTACHCDEDNVYRTDEDGTIEFITVGEKLWVRKGFPGYDQRGRFDKGRIRKITWVTIMARHG